MNFLVYFIPKNFILFDAVINGLVFLNFILLVLEIELINCAFLYHFLFVKDCKHVKIYFFKVVCIALQ